MRYEMVSSDRRSENNIINDSSSFSNFNIELTNVTEANIHLFKKLNQSIFPISYTESVYKMIVKNSINDPLELTKLAFIQNCHPKTENEISRDCAGILCCWLVDKSKGYTFRIPAFQRKNIESSSVNSEVGLELKRNSHRLYIVTLGCLPTRRKQGIGTKMMQHIIQQISDWDQSSHIESIFLHVQINNDEAIQFYKKFGFTIVKEVENYYPRLSPSNAYILERKLINDINK